jgi:hypothetical protein
VVACGDVGIMESDVSERLLVVDTRDMLVCAMEWTIVQINAVVSMAYCSR